MPLPFNLRDLEYLVLLDEERHFRRAAERGFVSQPTLSGQLKKLEEQLGVMLVERSSRSPEPTWPEGLALLREKRYGETALWWAEPSAAVQSAVP